MEVTVKWMDGAMVVGESGSGHSLVMDGPPDLGGRNLGPRPMEMLLLGDFIPAEKAAEIGLINRVVPADDLDAAAMAMAQQIVGKAPVAVRTGKRAFYEQADMPLEQAYAYAGRTMADNMMARDTRAGIDAFIAKEPMPEWQDA